VKLLEYWCKHYLNESTLSPWQQETQEEQATNNNKKSIINSNNINNTRAFVIEQGLILTLKITILIRSKTE
jgi:hypothetical protein